MRVSLDQIRQQNEADRREILDLPLELQRILEMQVNILRTSRYMDSDRQSLIERERLTA